MVRRSSAERRAVPLPVRAEPCRHSLAANIGAPAGDVSGISHAAPIGTSMLGPMYAGLHRIGVNGDKFSEFVFEHTAFKPRLYNVGSLLGVRIDEADAS